MVAFHGFRVWAQVLKCPVDGVFDAADALHDGLVPKAIQTDQVDVVGVERDLEGLPPRCRRRRPAWPR